LHPNPSLRKIYEKEGRGEGAVGIRLSTGEKVERRGKKLTLWVRNAVTLAA